MDNFYPLTLCLAEDPILRQVAAPIPLRDVNARLRRLAKEMLHAMRLWRGVGLAAPQVGHAIRLFVLDTRPARGTQYGAYLNPVVEAESPERRICDEGCLSFPGVLLEVERPWWIDVRYTTLAGHTVRTRLTGIDAQAFLHELEHLDGKLLGDAP